MSTTLQDEILDNVIVRTNLVLPIFPVIPPPFPIQGREGALAYQQSDEKVYYCDGEQWLILGQPGAQGTQGFQGSQGFQGFQGNNGTQGPQGEQGFQGGSGVQGFQGNQGSQGAAGFQGFQGGGGAQGGLGAQGAQGAQGSQGAQGFQGATGFQGSQGISGAQGGSSMIYFTATEPDPGIVGNQGRSVGMSLFGDDIAGTPGPLTSTYWFRSPIACVMDHMEVTMGLVPAVGQPQWPTVGTGTVTVTMYISTAPVDPAPANPYTPLFGATALTIAFSNIVVITPEFYSNNVTAAVPIPIGTLYGFRIETSGAQPTDGLIVAPLSLGVRVN